MLFLPWVASTQAVRNDLSRSLLTCILILYRVIWYLSYIDILVYTWWIVILYIFMLNKFCLSPESWVHWQCSMQLYCDRLQSVYTRKIQNTEHLVSWWGFSHCHSLHHGGSGWRDGRSGEPKLISTCHPSWIPCLAHVCAMGSSSIRRRDIDVRRVCFPSTSEEMSNLFASSPRPNLI